MAKRSNLKAQKARKAEKRQQKNALKYAAQLEYANSVKRDFLTNKQMGKVLSIQREAYIRNRDKGRVPTEIRAAIGIEDDRELGALIKQYWDYVNEGLIRAESGLSNYEIGEFMSMNKTPLEMKAAIEQADSWREATEAKEKARLERHMEWAKNAIQF